MQTERISCQRCEYLVPSILYIDIDFVLSTYETKVVIEFAF